MFQCLENFSIMVVTVFQGVLTDFMMPETVNDQLFMQNLSTKEWFSSLKPELRNASPEVEAKLNLIKRMLFAEIMIDVINVFEWTFQSDVIFIRGTNSKLGKTLLPRKRF